MGTFENFLKFGSIIPRKIYISQHFQQTGMDILKTAVGKNGNDIARFENGPQMAQDFDG